jgi:hypothetical protein
LGEIFRWARRDRVIAFYLAGIVVTLALIAIITWQLITPAVSPTVNNQAPAITTVVPATGTPLPEYSPIPQTVMPNQGRDFAPPAPPLTILPPTPS